MAEAGQVVLPDGVKRTRIEAALEMAPQPLPMSDRKDELRLRLGWIFDRLQILDRSLGILKRGRKTRRNLVGRLTREKILLLAEHAMIAEELARLD